MRPTGSYAEYAAASEDELALKPTNLTFEQAATVPMAGLVALQAIRDHGKVRAGQTVLINGASGGIGTFAVQIAKALGAEVTAVASTRNVELVRSIGADHVIDYTTDDFTRSGRALRRHPRQRREPLAGRHPARAHADRNADLERRRPFHRGQVWAGTLRTMLVVDRRPPAGRPNDQDPEPPRSACSQGPHRSREGHAGHRRHVPLERDGRGHRSRRDRTRARARSSSRSHQPSTRPSVRPHADCTRVAAAAAVSPTNRPRHVTAVRPRRPHRPTLTSSEGAIPDGSHSTDSRAQPIRGDTSSRREVGTRKTYARLIGALFLVGFLTYAIGFVLVNSVISAPDFPSNDPGTFRPPCSSAPS